MDDSEKLEVSFRRELKQNYLMIAADEDLGQRYEVRMLAGNIIDGVLKFRVRKENDQCWFCYEITSRQPLARLLERKSVTADQIRKLLLGIARTLTGMEDYLLSESMMLLDPEFIYVDPEEFQPGVCLFPGREGDFPREFSGFLQFLLSRTDHQDKEAVVLIYGLYQESLKENYGLDNLLRWLMKEDCPDLEYTGSGQKSETIDQNKIPRTEEQKAPAEAAVENSGGNRYETEISDDRKSPGIRASPSAAPIYKNPLMFGILPLLAAAALCMWKGPAGLSHYGIPVIGGAGALALIGAGFCIWKSGMGCKRQRGETERKKQTEEQEESWEMAFEADENEPQEEPVFISLPVQPEESSHTTLLWTRTPQTDIRSLTGEQGTQETIPVSYYPFLIGKQESLADYVIRHETISRMHARIDRHDDAYWLTDLNSTNGTAVNGRTLDANETVEIKIGDHVDMADLHFRFQ